MPSLEARAGFGVLGLSVKQVIMPNLAVQGAGSFREPCGFDEPD